MAKMIVPTEKPKLIHTKISRNPVNKDSIEAMTPETDKTVTGTFVNIECSGQPAKICGKYYRGMDYFSRTFMDGERVSIPLSVARFINERCHYEEHGYILDDKGNPIKNPKPRARYKFIVEAYA